MPTFNGDTLIITLDAGEPEVNAKVDLYSDWKEWLKTGSNAKYPLAFDILGGDPTTATGVVAPFYFLRNDLGWRIRPAEEDGNVTITGNLYPRNPALPIMIPTVGAYTTLVSMERDASAVVEAVTSAVTQQDKLDIRDLVMGANTEGSMTLAEIIRLLAAINVGNIVRTGNTYSIRSAADSGRERVGGTMDANYNRTITNVDVAP